MVVRMSAAAWAAGPDRPPRAHCGSRSGHRRPVRRGATRHLQALANDRPAVRDADDAPFFHHIHQTPAQRPSTPSPSSHSSVECRAAPPTAYWEMNVTQSLPTAAIFQKARAARIAARSSSFSAGLSALRRTPAGRFQCSTASKAGLIMAAADTDFDSYSPKVAFLFPGQGAQAVGMAKV